MMAAVAANMKIGFELAIKQHLLAAWAFVPEIFRHPLPGDDCPDLRQNKIGEPAHRRLVAGRRCLVEPPYQVAGWERAGIQAKAVLRELDPRVHVFASGARRRGCPWNQ